MKKDKLIWIRFQYTFSGTVRENILFGSHYDEERYNRTVFACALKEDLEKFPEGDATIIGERGSNLSGGQKQRISLGNMDYF